MVRVELTNETPLECRAETLCQAVEMILADAGFKQGEVSIAIVDDPKIHELNRRYLDHDAPTDVLSFVLENRADHLEGEIVASADTACRAASEQGWAPQDELLLYVIHGALHLVGYDDRSSSERRRMRATEALYLRRLGIEFRGEHAIEGSHGLE